MALLVNIFKRNEVISRVEPFLTLRRRNSLGLSDVVLLFVQTGKDGP